jgi:hypothetical protein
LLQQHVYLNVFNHIVTIWKNYMNFFLRYDECHNQFWRKVVSYLVLWALDGLMTKSIEAGVHIWGGGREKQNVKRWMWILLQSNSDESSSSHIVYKGGKSLEAILYSL